MNTTKKALRIAVIFSAFLALISCNPVEDDSESATMLLVDNMLGKDAEGKASNFLQSDVVLSTGRSSPTRRRRLSGPLPLTRSPAGHISL